MLNEFFKVAARLKSIPRQGWKDKINLASPESVSDHCFSMTVMAMTLGDILNLDTEKMMKMSLIHDLAESKIGDITPEMMSKNQKQTLENKTMREILGKLPEKLQKEYSTLWEDYCKNQSKESLLLHEIDKLEMALQAGIYSQEGVSKEKLSSFLDSAKNKIASPEIKIELEKILLDFKSVKN